MIEQSILFKNGKIHTPSGVIENGSLLVGVDGIIKDIASRSLKEISNFQVINLDGKTVIPGLIDLHVHGGNGFDVMSGTYEDLDEISRYHACHGTTSFLATTSGSATKEITLEALRVISNAIANGVSGANIVGIHLEGPFLNPRRKGAFKIEELRLPNRAEIDEYMEVSSGNIRLVTLAPEIEGGFEAVTYFKKYGVIVSIGHSDATYSETKEAIKLGVSHATHFFNGMRPFDHREPGVIGAGLMFPQLTLEVIADGIHLHPDVVKLIYELKGKEGVCAITDAVACAGLPDGDFGNLSILNGVVHVKGTNTLAGSTLTTIQALKNIMTFTGFTLDSALPSLTSVPAQQIGIYGRKGSLEIGKDADFLVIHDDMNILATYVQGREVYGSF